MPVYEITMYEGEVVVVIAVCLPASLSAWLQTHRLPAQGPPTQDLLLPLRSMYEHVRVRTQARSGKQGPGRLMVGSIKSGTGMGVR
jgi:hypothetical protein